MKNSRIFITGGAGFIGANLVRYFLDRGGYAITVYDNLSVGSEENLDHAVSDSKQRATVRFIEEDILDKERLEKETKGHTAIIHLAAHTNVVDSLKNPADDFTINAIGTLNVLEAARQNNIRNFIYASSNAVVGEQDPPINEDNIPTPLSPYGASKLTGEALCSAYYHSYGIRAISLRFANCYGPYSEHKTSVVAKFIRRAKRGMPLEIYGAGNQTRDFIHVSDVCQAIYLSLNPYAPNPNIWGEVFQIGTGKETRIVDMAKMVSNVTNGEKKNILFTAPRKGEISKNFSDITKAKRFLGFKPQIELREGLKELWNEEE